MAPLRTWLPEPGAGSQPAAAMSPSSCSPRPQGLPIRRLSPPAPPPLGPRPPAPVPRGGRGHILPHPGFLCQEHLTGFLLDNGTDLFKPQISLRQDPLSGASHVPILLKIPKGLPVTREIKNGPAPRRVCLPRPRPGPLASWPHSRLPSLRTLSRPVTIARLYYVNSAPPTTRRLHRVNAGARLPAPPALPS